MVVQEKSHVVGAKEPPLLEMTIGDALDEAARKWPDEYAIISAHQNLRWRYKELNDRAEALAAGFYGLGLRAGDRIGIWSPNCAEWALTQFAAAKLGLILVTINPAYRSSELAYTLNKVGIKALVAAERFRSSNYVAMMEALEPQIAESEPGGLRSETFPALQYLLKIGGENRKGWIQFDTLLRLDNDSLIAKVKSAGSSLKPEDPINIQFTSGTTGHPKGATLSHRNILNNGYFVGRRLGLRQGDRLCLPVPLYHCFGMVMGNLGCLTHGATMVYPSEIFNPQAALETVEAEQCTGLFGVPTMFIAMLEHPAFSNHDLASLRTGCMAGSPCPIEVMKQVIEQMNIKDITIAYGMTETSPVSFQSMPDDPIERRVSTIGTVHPHLEVKIVEENGETAPRGTPGEICTRGYSVMLGYWGDDERTAEAIDAGGWMHTGDLGVIDADGYGNVVGRLKDMVIRGGENLYPREIEEFLFQHPNVADVQVVGVPDEKYGEELCAWIRVKAGSALSEEDVREFCDGRITRHKVPRYIRFVEEFPTTVTGKVQKFEIRNAMVRELNLNVSKTA
ncbi:AMP-binding protein [Hyphococcus luteus]|uniref:3-methylmercaptopropionyl-CoA ligase n=1 Tax=Hyphococcus luteus TaxID=2058213 RepID=A0A2S7KAB0_9PROT|nr:AMP-binding protein [Marinicaulis flavus]